jgi:hypothetical protein
MSLICTPNGPGIKADDCYQNGAITRYVAENTHDCARASTSPAEAQRGKPHTGHSGCNKRRGSSKHAYLASRFDRAGRFPFCDAPSSRLCIGAERTDSKTLGERKAHSRRSCHAQSKPGRRIVSEIDFAGAARILSLDRGIRAFQLHKCTCGSSTRDRRDTVESRSLAQEYNSLLALRTTIPGIHTG